MGREPNASSIPIKRGWLKRPYISVVNIPIMALRTAWESCSSSRKRKPSRRASLRTRSRVFWLSFPCPLIALDAVPIATPAASATSRRVAPFVEGVQATPAAPLHYAHCLRFLRPYNRFQESFLSIRKVSGYMLKYSWLHCGCQGLFFGKSGNLLSLPTSFVQNVPR